MRVRECSNVRKRCGLYFKLYRERRRREVWFVKKDVCNKYMYAHSIISKEGKRTKERVSEQ